MRKGMFGPIIGVVILLFFIVVAVAFSTLIFSSEEASMGNITNMSNESQQAYNMTTDLVQTGLTVWDVLTYLLILGAIIFGLEILIMAIK